MTSIWQAVSPLTCHYCYRIFKRGEHLRRHLRTRELLHVEWLGLGQHASQTEQSLKYPQTPERSHLAAIAGKASPGRTF